LSKSDLWKGTTENNSIVSEATSESKCRNFQKCVRRFKLQTMENEQWTYSCRVEINIEK
jgi:hypothetical protein